MDLKSLPEEENTREDKSNWHRSERKQSHTNEERNKFKSNLPVKLFCHRNSFLTDLMNLKQMQTVHNIFIIFFILLVISTTPTTFWGDVRTIMIDSSKLSMCCTMWISLNVSCVIVYYIFKWWTLHRIQHQKKTGILDCTLLLLYIIYWVSMFPVTAFYVVKFQVHSITTFALLCEQIRIAMKIHSFVRENVPRVLNMTLRKGKKILIRSVCPTFHHFVYYLFAPTLIYRDSYPRTSTIRWKFVLTNLLHFFACFLIICCIYHSFYIHIFRNMGEIKPTTSYLALILASSIVFSVFFMPLAFYGFLHCWMNAFAEILRFGDRLFYQDWWNSTTFSQFLRKWNYIVHEWLHTYVHMELQRMGCNKISSMMMTLLISSIAHEFLMSLAFRFCVPILFLIYSTIGALLVYLTKRGRTLVWNILVEGIFFFGAGLLVFFYNMESFSRNTCPRIFDGPMDYFVPRFWGCKI